MELFLKESQKTSDKVNHWLIRFPSVSMGQPIRAAETGRTGVLWVGKSLENHGAGMINSFFWSLRYLFYNL